MTGIWVPMVIVKKVCQRLARLKAKVEESTILSDTGLLGELVHLKIKTRLIDEKFECDG
jgi:hypothetical protein